LARLRFRSKRALVLLSEALAIALGVFLALWANEWRTNRNHLAEGASQFVGTWSLVSWETELEDGTTRQDPRSVGYIMYSDTGHMCYLSMDPERPDWGTWSDPTSSEARSAIMGIGAYCGGFEVDEEMGLVFHQVKVEKVPNNVGILRRRHYEFLPADRLALTVEDREDLPPEVVRVRLLWERVSR
jgi:hypothetical protein